MKIRQQKIETKPLNFVVQENSNTESCEEEIRKPSPPTFKKPQKSSADAIWRKRIAEATLETEEDAKESSDRPVVPLNASERPTDGMAVSYPAGREEDIIRFATKIDCGETDEYLIDETNSEFILDIETADDHWEKERVILLGDSQQWDLYEKMGFVHRAWWCERGFVARGFFSCSLRL